MRRSELKQRWMSRLKHCREMGDERGEAICRLVIDDLEALDGEPEQGGYWSTSEAANYLGLSTRTVQKMCKDGAFGGVKKTTENGSYLIPKQSVIEYSPDDGGGDGEGPAAPTKLPAVEEGAA